MYAQSDCDMLYIYSIDLFNCPLHEQGYRLAYTTRKIFFKTVDAASLNVVEVVSAQYKDRTRVGMFNVALARRVQVTFFTCISSDI